MFFKYTDAEGRTVVEECENVRILDAVEATRQDFDDQRTINDQAALQEPL